MHTSISFLTESGLCSNDFCSLFFCSFYCVNTPCENNIVNSYRDIFLFYYLTKSYQIPNGIMLKIRLTRNKWDRMIAEPILIQNSILVNDKDPLFIQFRLANWLNRHIHNARHHHRLSWPVKLSYSTIILKISANHETDLALKCLLVRICTVLTWFLWTYSNSIP